MKTSKSQNQTDSDRKWKFSMLSQTKANFSFEQFLDAQVTRKKTFIVHSVMTRVPYICADSRLLCCLFVKIDRIKVTT